MKQVKKKYAIGDEANALINGNGREFSLYCMVEQLGDLLSGDIHVIDTSEQYPNVDGEKSFRVYHKDGYCFDVKKRAVINEGDALTLEGWEFDFLAEWDGFKKCNIETAIELVKNYTNT